MAENGSGNGDAQRALEEIRELRKIQAEATKEQTAALGSINTHLARIEGIVAGQAEGNTARDRRMAESERHIDELRAETARKIDEAKAEFARKAEELKAEVAAIKLEAAARAASGAPLQRLAWLIITAIVLGFGSMIFVNMKQTPPNITIQMPASTSP